MTWGSVPPEESNLGAELALIDWSRDAIVISHLRTDHYLYLVPLRYGARYRKKGQERIDVWVPTGGIEHLRLLGACLSTTQPFFESAFAFHEYVPDSLFTIGSMVLTAVPVWHSIPAHALRVVASERTFVFSSDTAPCARLDEVATGADLLLAETTFGTKAYAPGWPASPWRAGRRPCCTGCKRPTSRPYPLHPRNRSRSSPSLNHA